MSEAVIRFARPEDAGASVAVERLAFESDAEATIVESVWDAEGSFALLADIDGAMVGHVQFSRAWIGDVAAVALGPIGVHPEHQGQGIGSALIRQGLDEAQARGEPAVMLLGSPAFYPRFGFQPGLALGLQNPFAGVQPDGFVVAEEDFMIAVLDPLAPLHGSVRWHAAFRQAG